MLFFYHYNNIANVTKIFVAFSWKKKCLYQLCELIKYHIKLLYKLMELWLRLNGGGGVPAPYQINFENNIYENCCFKAR